MSKQKFYIVLDTETVTDSRVPFDVGMTIINRKGEIHKQLNWFTKEILDTLTGIHVLSKDSFSKRKLPFYLKIKEEQSHLIVPFDFIKANFEKEVAALNNNVAVVAYNAAFDVRALNNYSNSLGLGDFFNKDVEIWDLLNIALHSLCNSKNYVEFALINNFITEAGNIKSSAEAVFNYLLKGEKFEEDHTALSDTEIEARILIECFKRHKKLETDFAGPLFHHPIWKDRLKLS